MKRIFYILLFINTLTVSVFAQNSISLQVKTTAIEGVLKEIERQSGYTFSYNPDLLKDIAPVSANFRNQSLGQVINFLFGKTDIQHIVKNQHVVLKKKEKIQQKNRTLSGYIYDDETTETLIGANIFDPHSGRGTVSNNYGFFSISVPENSAELRASYIGYTPSIIRLANTRDTTFHIRMKSSGALKALVVERDNVSPITNSDIGKITMNSAELKSAPAFLSESDLLKTLQLTPGVTAGAEGIAGMYVRGGNLDENLYLVDGNPVYHVNHMLGIFSTFNSDAVKIMNFYKGSFPARFGGRLSSVVDMRMNDGDSKKIGGTVSVGLLATRLNLNGPIIKDKTTFNISLRRTYFDLFTIPLFAIARKNNYYSEGNYESMDMAYNFYDLNGKISHKFSDRSRLFLSIYAGNDKMRGDYTDVNNDNRKDPKSVASPYFSDKNEQNKIKIAWGTKLASLNWAYQFNNKLYAGNTLIYSQYHSDITSSEKGEYVFEPKPSTTGLTKRSESNSKSALYGSGITDFGVRSDFDYTPVHNHYIRFGATLINHYFRPEHTQVGSVENNDGVKFEKTFTYANDSVNIFETSLYAEDEMNVSDKIKLNLGVHISNFNVKSKNYFSLQPRVSVRYLLTENISLKASYAQMNQYLHLLQNSNLSLPNDLWMPITEKIKPLVSHQVAGGVYWDYRKFNFSMEAYYKASKNQMEYKEGAELFMSGKDWEERVAQGNGKAYGVEWFVTKKQGKTTGWAGYALSWATRRFPNGEINSGKPYYAKYDNRHKINIVVNHKFSRKIDLSASWFFATGNRISLPLEKYSSVTGREEYYYPEKNNYVTSPYHRLDLSINFTKQKKRGIRIWNISLYNAYFHRNAFIIQPDTKDYWSEGNQGNYVKTESEYLKISIFPIIPSFSYTFKF